MKLRWKRQKAQTGLAAVCASPRGYEYHDGEKQYANVSALMGDRQNIFGWYWVAGWDSNVPYKNTCDQPCATPEEAKAQAVKYVQQHLASSI